MHFFALTPLMGMVSWSYWEFSMGDEHSILQTLGSVGRKSWTQLHTCSCDLLTTFLCLHHLNLGKKYGFCLGVTVCNSLLPIHKINEEWESLLIFSLIPISVFGSSRWHDSWVRDHHAESSYEGVSANPCHWAVRGAKWFTQNWMSTGRSEEMYGLGWALFWGMQTQHKTVK